MNEDAAFESTDRWADVARVGDVWEGELVPATVWGFAIFLVNVGGAIRAYEDRCPHQRNPLSDGTLEDSRIVCRYHNWCFDLGSGKGINPEDAELVRIPVRIREQMIQVERPPWA